MNKKELLSGGAGEGAKCWSIEYESSVLYKFGISGDVSNGIKNEPKFRNEHTDGKFMTNTEYIKYIRIKKLKKINDNNEDNS